MNKKESEQSEPNETMNDVKSEEFESHMDDFFTSKTKEKDTWATRKSSIKLFGQWT